MSDIKEVTKEMLSTLKSQVVSFVQSSEGLTCALDELGKLHPFLMGAFEVHCLKSSLSYFFSYI